MSQCVQRALMSNYCVRRTLSLVQSRCLHNQGSPPAPSRNQEEGLLDLSAIHTDWKGAGYFPRAPREVSSHGAKCLTTLLQHNNITKHVFGGEEHRLFPLSAAFGERELDFGGILSPKHCLTHPQVSWKVNNLNADSRYTLIMVSPDCTSCPVHWCVSDLLPSPAPLTKDTSQTNTSPIDTNRTDTSHRADTEQVTLLEYVPPVPLKGTGFYRYVLVLLQQTGPTPDSVSRSDSLTTLMSRCKLHPVGAAMFQACWDESVGYSLATHLQADEKQYRVQRVKNNAEHRAEELFLRKEWEMKTGFM